MISFTSSSSYDVINLCLTKMWQFYEINEAYLNGVFPSKSDIETEQTEGMQKVLYEQDLIL